MLKYKYSISSREYGYGLLLSVIDDDFRGDEKIGILIHLLFNNFYDDVNLVLSENIYDEYDNNRDVT